MKTAVLGLLTLLCSLLFFSCAYPQLKKEAPEINVLKKGSKFRITLPEDHSLGETWQINTSWNDSLEDLGSVWHGAEKGLDVNLKALSTGEYTISCFKRKYQDTVEIKRYLLTIVEN